MTRIGHQYRARVAVEGTVRLAEAEDRLGVAIPPLLRALYASADGRYSRGSQYWVVWPLARVVEDNERAWGDGTLSHDLLAFGDDGTGNPFCVSVSPPADEVLRWNWLDGEVEFNEGTMQEFSREWLADA